MSRWPAVALGAPACVLAIALAVVLGLAAAGRHPLWRPDDFNLSEAASVRDEAEVVRLIRHGHDPDGRRDIRPGLLFDRGVRLTPLEAAVAAERAEMVERLLANGAHIDAGLWNQLRCLAHGTEVPLALERHRPAGAAMQCENVTRPW